MGAHTLDVSFVPQEDQYGEKCRGANDGNMCTGEPNINHSSEGGKNTGKGNDFECSQYQQKGDKGEKEDGRGITGKDPEREQKTIQCGNGLSAMEAEKNRITVSEGGRGGTAGSGPGVVAEFECQEDRKGDFQQVQRHNGNAGLLSQDPSGIASARIAAAVISDVCLVKKFSDDVSEGDRTDEVTDQTSAK